MKNVLTTLGVPIEPSTMKTVELYEKIGIDCFPSVLGYCYQQEHYLFPLFFFWEFRLLKGVSVYDDGLKVSFPRVVRFNPCLTFVRQKTKI